MGVPKGRNGFVSKGRKYLVALLRRLRSFSRSWRWRRGLRVAAPQLEDGGDKTVIAFYRSRVTDCSFLVDPLHYEYPRLHWILERSRAGKLLEIGCGNGGMTRLLAPQVDFLLALDVSAPSLKKVDELELHNVETVESLIERYQTMERFDRIVLSEVLEHLREPEKILVRCVEWLSPGGSLLLTTPNGHWESDEHLQEFSLARFGGMLARVGAESFHVGYLRDGKQRRRWLVGQVTASTAPQAPDDFHDHRAVARYRKHRRRISGG